MLGGPWPLPSPLGSATGSIVLLHSYIGIDLAGVKPSLESGSIVVLGNFLFFFVVFIIVLATMNMTLIYLIISELTLFYLLMFSIILLLVYFDYMLSVVSLELCLCIGSYSAYSIGQWVSGIYCVGKVPRPYLSTIIPYSLDHEVDHGSNSPVESFVVLLLSIRIVEHHYYMDVIAIFMIFLGNITMDRYNIFL